MTDFMSVKDKVVIITGSADGMGKTIAKLYCENGMKVIVADLNEEKGRKTVDEIISAGGAAKFFPVDVSKDEDVKAMVDFALEAYGRLDGIINNAGIGTDNKPFHEYTPQEYDSAMAVDQKSVFLGMRYGIEAILNSKSTSGFVINISSLAGITGNSSLGIYSAAKHAVVGMSKCAALDYAKQNITVNCICPGTILTSIWRDAPEEIIQHFANMFSPSGRLGMPEEIAYLALFLASDMARYITGAAIPVDGGSSAGKVTAKEI